MWFRNLRVYRLSADWGRTPTRLNELLAKKLLARCGNSEMVSRGWVYAKHEDFVHAVNGQWLVALGVEKRLLPMTVVRQVAQERAAEIEAEQDRKVGRKEMRDLREAVLQELMPRAFTSRRSTWAWIDPINGWLVIDAGSDAKADEFLEVFLHTVGEVQLRPLQTERSPSSAMTEWLASGDAPIGFSVDDDLELRAASTGQSAIRYVRHVLEGKEIQEHIGNGKVATRLALTWNDRISFVLSDKGQIKRLAFLDILQDEAEQSAVEADEEFDINFALMAGELNKLLGDLLAALGGEVKPA